MDRKMSNNIEIGIPNEPMPMTEEEYLGSKGVKDVSSGWILDKLRGNRQLKTQHGVERFNREFEKAEREYQEKREAAQQEYREKIKSGELRDKTLIERSIDKAHGHDDNPSVQAARRVLEKRGIDWRTGEPLNNIEKFDPNHESLNKLIREHYATDHKDLIITNRMVDRIVAVILSADNLDKIPAETVKEKIAELLERDTVISFIENRQPCISQIPDHVQKEIEDYFAANHPQYFLLNLYRKSNHPEEGHLYSILAQKESGEFGCWTCWDDRTKKLNHGHVDLKSKNEAFSILKENFYDITDELEHYGIEASCKFIREEKQLHFSENENNMRLNIRHHR